MTAMELKSCIAERWTPQIGDPNLTGWLTVLIYLITALLSFAAWRRMGPCQGRTFWASVVIFLLILAINKQLDLQSALTAGGKCLANTHGWYDNRRIVQGVFIAALIAIVLLGLSMAMLALRGTLRHNALALLGLATVSLFVMARAVSIHGFDYIIGQKNFGISNNFVFESIGLFLISLNALIIIIKFKIRDSS